MSRPKIVLLAGKGDSTNILYNALENEISLDAVILEDPVPRRILVKKRIKKLGAWKVTGQILFQLIIVPLLDIFSTKRKEAIMLRSGMNKSPIPADKVNHMTSVNDERCIQLLQTINPGIVIVNGTRIISSQVLNAVQATFINIHAGITPKYRGVHGAYWALVNNDAAHCGVTVHVVDKGIDTGAVISQEIITVTRADNFVTYPLLQLEAGIPKLKQAVSDLLQQKLHFITVTTESRLWSHPGFRQYLFYRIKGKR